MSQNVICYSQNKIKDNLATEKVLAAIFNMAAIKVMAKNENYVTLEICVIN